LRLNTRSGALGRHRLPGVSRGDLPVGVRANLNRIAREFFPKGVAITSDPDYLTMVASEINDRPRKIHNGKKPSQLSPTRRDTCSHWLNLPSRDSDWRSAGGMHSADGVTASGHPLAHSHPPPYQSFSCVSASHTLRSLNRNVSLHSLRWGILPTLAPLSSNGGAGRNTTMHRTTRGTGTTTSSRGRR
jgi:hypothetical protein